MTSGLRRQLAASPSDGSDFPYAIVIGAAVGVLAMLLIAAGLLCYCRERRRNKALALEPFVNLAPNPPASQLSPGIATAANQQSATKLQLTGSMDAHAGFYVMTSPMNSRSQPPAMLKPTNSHDSASQQSTSFLASDPSVHKSFEDTRDLDTFDTSARSRINSFEAHESFRRAMGYSDSASSSAQTANSNSYNNSNKDSSSRHGGLWDDPAIVAARIPLDRVVTEFRHLGQSIPTIPTIV
uniref:Uncharacterized protein n=1 Tax=Phytophthora fragariae TaxID=53985 RepID=A0A6A3EKW0_9STRA|nr:hypothetical protein PF009_g16842 [Phytophthora fragariae]